ncbi:MAG: hypothetical protein QHH04_03350 [Methanolinea sp.]|jgi:hypothetical protein|nr:hypothetical protein [Methanolinea sp.]
MSNHQSVYDVIPINDLQQISLYQEKAVELEHKASVMISDAQDLRVKAEDIAESYR